MEINKNPNYFVRSLIVLLCLLVAGMVVYNFLFIDPKGEINTSLIMLIAILVVIVLSESFDNFSIVKLVSISRDNKKKETAINRLSTENEELRKQIITIATSVNQNQSSTNIIGMPEDVIRKFIVQRASDEEIQERETEESSVAEQRPARKRPDFRRIEELALNKFLESHNMEKYSVIKEAKLVTQFHGIDSISNVQPIFDGYINTGDEEIFIEVRPSFSHFMMWKERIYLMLNKINLYKSVKQVNAYLSLVVVNIPEEVIDRRSRDSLARIEEFFEPAIANGLLRITCVDLSNEEAESCMREVR